MHVPLRRRREAQALDALDEITNSCVVEREWRIRIDREIEIVVKVSDELTADAHR